MHQATEPTTIIDVIEFLQSRINSYGDRNALMIKEGDQWRGLTYKQLSDEARSLGSYLMERGVQTGDRVAILSESRPEWGVCFFAAVRSGATVVPLDVKLTETELTNIMSDCEPVLIFADSKHVEVAKKVAAKVKSIKNILVVEHGKGSTEHPSIDQVAPTKIVEGRSRNLDEIALFVYTSGTTGNPKGVMISYGNLIFQVNSFEGLVGLRPTDRFLSILPLNHLLELTGGFLGVLNHGGTVYFCSSLFPQEIIKAMRENKITGMVAVPLFFKSLRSGLEREIKKAGGDEALQKFQGGLLMADAMPMEQRRQVFAKVHEALGGDLRVLISGGAPLEPEVGLFFQRLGINLLQGYGLTETSPVVSGNSIKANRIGSVGQALPGVEIRLDIKNPGDTEGEILTRGPHIMRGYYRRDDMTSEVVDSDGWFHTGDIGRIDEDGFLYITGRLKNLIVLGGGKKVFPEEVETAMGESPCFKDVCVLAAKQSDGFKEGTEEVCIVVVPSDALVHEHEGDKEAIKQAVKKEVERLGENLAQYKRPTRILVHWDELPKTCTRKVKRPLVAQWVKEQVN